MTERPQDTGCTSIEVDADGTDVGAERIERLDGLS